MHYRDAYMALVGAVPALLNTTNPFGLALPDASSLSMDTRNLEANDYPLVNFWHRMAWKKAEDRPKLQKGQSGNGKNIAQTYIEDENGKAASGERAESIRRAARNIWAQFWSEGVAPDKWENASHEVVHRFNRAMWKEAPELRLCAENWKTHYLAMSLYPGWVKNRKRKVMEVDGTTVKIEDIAVLNSQGGVKRSADESGKENATGENVLKKPKIMPFKV